MDPTILFLVLCLDGNNPHATRFQAQQALEAKGLAAYPVLVQMTNLDSEAASQVKRLNDITMSRFVHEWSKGQKWQRLGWDFAVDSPSFSYFHYTESVGDRPAGEKDKWWTNRQATRLWVVDQYLSGEMKWEEVYEYLAK